VDDQELREQVEKARGLLEGVSTDALRNMPLVRSFVREGMANIAAQMDVLAGDRVSRKFRFDEAYLRKVVSTKESVIAHYPRSTA